MQYYAHQTTYNFNFSVIGEMQLVNELRELQDCLRKVHDFLQPVMPPTVLLQVLSLPARSTLPGFSGTGFTARYLADFLHESYLHKLAVDAIRQLTTAHLFHRLGRGAPLLLPLSVGRAETFNARPLPTGACRILYLSQLSSTSVGSYMHVNGNHWIFWLLSLQDGSIIIGASLQGLYNPEIVV